MASCLFIQIMFSRIIKKYTVANALILFFALSCHNPEHPAEAAEKKTEAPPATTTEPLIDTIYAGMADTAIQLERGEIFINGHILANEHPPRYTISGRKGQMITAVIKPTKEGGNVRINQIRQPGGAFDGPFGDSLSYTFKRNGDLQFIIGENLMAGDPYTGDFNLHIILAGL